MHCGQEELEPKDKNLIFEHKSESLCPIPSLSSQVAACMKNFNPFSCIKVTCVEKPWHV